MDLTAAARSMIDANLSLTLATAHAGGRPWATPASRGHDDHTEFLWASFPEATHSRAVEARPEVRVVTCDSVPVR